MRGKLFISVYGLLAALLFCPIASVSEITGQVRDPSGAYVSRARIGGFGRAGAKLKMAVTDENGRFQVSGLAPGKYVLQAESSRFETVNVNVDIREDATNGRGERSCTVEGAACELKLT